jgi:hypothetical protein
MQILQEQTPLQDLSQYPTSRKIQMWELNKSKMNIFLLFLRSLLLYIQSYNSNYLLVMVSSELRNSSMGIGQKQS